MDSVMTPEEFKLAMLDASLTTYEFEGHHYIDHETAHEKMDDLMCQVLKELGYGDGIDIFSVTTKWYA